MQSGPNSAAERTPVHGAGGCGARQRKLPTGGAANGMPLNQSTPFESAPRSMPVSMRTVSGARSAAAGPEAARPPRMSRAAATARKPYFTGDPFASGSRRAAGGGGRRLAGEIRLFIAAAAAVVACNLRMRTERAGARRAGRSCSAGDHAVGRAAMLDPVDQGAEQVDTARPRPAEAMLEARHHEQEIETVDIVDVHLDLDHIMIFTAVPGRLQRTVPVIIDY